MRTDLFDFELPAERIALRPAQPLQVVTGSSWFAPRDSFVYPGGEREI